MCGETRMQPGALTCLPERRVDRLSGSCGGAKSRLLTDGVEKVRPASCAASEG